MTIKGQKINRSLKKIREFEEWMPEKLTEHLSDGWSINSFAPKYNVSTQHWHIICRTNEKLIPIRNEYMSTKRYRPKSFG